MDVWLEVAVDYT